MDLLKILPFLKDKSKPLYSPICGNVKLIGINNEKIIVECYETKKQYEFSINGKLYTERNNLNAKTLLFPSDEDNLLEYEDVIIYNNKLDTLAKVYIANNDDDTIFAIDSLNENIDGKESHFYFETVYKMSKKDCILATKEQCENYYFSLRIKKKCSTL